MTDIQIFNNPDFGDIRTVEIDGKPYFVGRDIAKALGYSDPHKAVSRHCKGGMKYPIGVQTGTGADGTPIIQDIDMLIISEGDVYRLIIKSQLPAAEKFER